MAEIVGIIASGVTLAGLFKGCLDAIDLIQAARHQDLEVKKLILKLAIEKCRLYTWGEAVGLTTVPSSGQPRAMDLCPANIQELVRDTLEMIICVFTDAQKLKDRYGCKDVPIEADRLLCARSNDVGPAEKLAMSFSSFQAIDRSADQLERLKLKTRWIVNDRKKFMALVAELKAFIDGLHDLTKSTYSVDGQETMDQRVQQVDDAETLELIADICEGDYPSIADAASERSAILSFTTEPLWDIEQWNSDVVPGSQGQPCGLESLTLTELKYRLVALAIERASFEDHAIVEDICRPENVAIRIISIVPAMLLLVRNSYTLESLRVSRTSCRLLIEQITPHWNQ
jgi:hypothetical protein